MSSRRTAIESTYKSVIIVVAGMVLVAQGAGLGLFAQSEKAGSSSEHAQQPSSVGALSRPANTIYIDSPPDAQPIKKEMLDRILKWGEIKIVTLPAQADLIFPIASPNLVLETPRLHRRRLTVEDAPWASELDRDPEVMRYLTGGVATPPEHSSRSTPLAKCCRRPGESTAPHIGT